MEPNPMKYNSKMMNSIWGMYNRYSVHNFKKNIDDKVGGFAANQQRLVYTYLIFFLDDIDLILCSMVC